MARLRVCRRPLIIGQSSSRAFAIRTGCLDKMWLPSSSDADVNRASLLQDTESRTSGKKEKALDWSIVDEFEADWTQELGSSAMLCPCLLLRHPPAPCRSKCRARMEHAMLLIH